MNTAVSWPPFFAAYHFMSSHRSLSLSRSDDVRRKAGEMDGVFVLLKSISAYRKEDPKSEEETEYMLNLFDALCSMLMVQEVRGVCAVARATLREMRDGKCKFHDFLLV